MIHWLHANSAILTALGAIVVFGSWIITNRISVRLDAARSAVDRATADDNLRQRLDTIGRRYREGNAVLRRIDAMLSQLNPKSTYASKYGTDEATEAAFFHQENLGDGRFALSGLMRAHELPANLLGDINRVMAEARVLEGQFTVIAAKWNADKASAVAVTQKAMANMGPVYDAQKSADLIDAQAKTDDMFKVAAQEFRKKAFPVTEQMMAMERQISEVRGRALTELRQRYASLQRAYAISARASWYLYALGTVLVIVGNLLGSK